ncbi:MAG: pseudouridine synthase, partial [Parachlamydiaceae bacterium]
MNPTEDFFITQEEANLRLDKLLADKFSPHFSRTYFANLMEEGLVLLNGKKAKKRHLGQEGDQVEIFFRMQEPTDLIPENIPLDVVYEDEYMLVVNKPVGMVVHPAVGNWSGTFVNALLYHCHVEKDGSLRPGIVHRLDKETSGLLIGAKTAEAQKRLMELFSSRSIYKEYRANTFGVPPVGKVETLIGRNPKNRQEMAVVLENGKRAVTDIEVLQKEGEFAYVKCVIETGRT